MLGGTKLLTALLCGIVLWAGTAGLLPAAGAAGAPGACSVGDARADLRAAKAALARAEQRVAQARFVLSATERYGGLYGSSVGRWVRLARRVSWPKSQFPTLMYVVDRESGGDPNAKNPTSTASGLLQFLSSWWEGKWDPFDPRQNLRHGYLAWQESGWQPWGM